MVEIKSEENNTVQLPNNIRQVGTPGEKIKIYIEDYVMTYLNQMTGEKPALQKAALLLGEKVKKESTDIYFISAAVAVVPMEWKEDRFKLSSDEWTALYDKINHYFKNRHILGWFLSRLGQAAAADGEIEKIHSDNFKDKGPIFYTADPLDREDAFYLYENGHLFRQHGYYIYYDRNEAMQNYMMICFFLIESILKSRRSFTHLLVVLSDLNHIILPRFSSVIVNVIAMRAE